MKKIKLGDTCSIIKGSTGIQKAIPGEYPLVVTAETRLTCNEYQFDNKAVCIPLVSSTGHGHASLKRIHYQEGKFALGNILSAVIPNDETQLNAEYLYHYLSFYKDEKIVPLMKGAANVSLTINSIKTIEIDIPDIQTQLKIVESINNIKNTSNLLNDKIIEQEKYINDLRKSILQEAVQGKLVLQNPNDEPASELLKKVKAEKEQLFKEGKIKKEKTLQPITESEIPYNLPIGWKWARFINLISYEKNSIKRGPFGSAIKKSFFVPKGKNTYKVYEQKNAIRDDFFIGDYYINETKYNELNQFEVKDKDIIISCSGTIGKVAIAPIGIEKGIINQALLKITLNEEIVDANYFKIMFASHIMNTDYIAEAKGSAMKNVPSVDILKTTPIPLSPLKEQKRIIAKVDELMKLCDELEEQIKQSKQHSELLMQSILQESFNPQGQNNPNFNVVDIVPIMKKRALASAEIITQLHDQKNFGAVKNEKLLYLFEKHYEQDLGGNYIKMPAGPYDADARYKVEEILKEKKWFIITKEKSADNDKVVYNLAENHNEYKPAFDSCFTNEEKSNLQEIIDIFRNKNKSECEAIATLYAVWNDFLIDVKTPSDEDIVQEFRNNWDESKKDFNPSDLSDYLIWMRSKGLIPRGQGIQTIKVKE